LRYSFLDLQSAYIKAARKNTNRWFAHEKMRYKPTNGGTT
jgi:hypothetical protein